MPYEDLKEVVNQAKKLGAKSVVIIGGGEPTINSASYF
jgi:MoaA/NifB/PqqE/SkfB family radical SAM enzyme